jgi:hypothetical protein
MKVVKMKSLIKIIKLQANISNKTLFHSIIQTLKARIKKYKTIYYFNLYSLKNKTKIKLKVLLTNIKTNT